MEMILSAIPLTSTSHWGLSSGSLSTIPAIRAPWIGGLEYSGRINILICDRTRSASSFDSQVAVIIPTLSPDKQGRTIVTRADLQADFTYRS